jgi:ACS family sodium-dependent inorganic phosphate cotransporter
MNNLLGISNTMATVPGIISPYLTGLIVQNSTVDEWRIVFFISATIYVIGTIVYSFFGKGEIQSWAADRKENEKENPKAFKF